MGLALAVPTARTVCMVEREAYCLAILRARQQDGSLDDCPLWTDLTTFDGNPWRGVVDILHSGFPCQPFSVAGRRAGTSDERWTWPDIARIIGEVRPRFVFLENVPGIFSGGFAVVLGDLAALGFDAEWDCFRASDVGAPHKRERVFILAYSTSNGRKRDESFGTKYVAYSRRASAGTNEPIAQSERSNTANASVGRQVLADAISSRCDGRAPDPVWCPEERTVAERASEALGNAQSFGRPERWAEQQGWKRVAASIEPSSSTSWPPDPTDTARWRKYLADGGPEPAVRRSPAGTALELDPLRYRIDRLRALGNGVVPECAAFAFSILARRLNATDLYKEEE